MCCDHIAFLWIVLCTDVKLTNPPSAGRQLLLSKKLGDRWSPISLQIVCKDSLLFVCGIFFFFFLNIQNKCDSASISRVCSMEEVAM